VFKTVKYRYQKPSGYATNLAL